MRARYVRWLLSQAKAPHASDGALLLIVRLTRQKPLLSCTYEGHSPPLVLSESSAGPNAPRPPP